MPLKICLSLVSHLILVSQTLDLGIQTLTPLHVTTISFMGLLVVVVVAAIIC